MEILFIIFQLKYAIIAKISLFKIKWKIESVQYSAALTIARTWKGTSREKICAELGWKSISCRRLSSLTPEYTNDLIPTPHHSKYSLRNHDAVG